MQFASIDRILKPTTIKAIKALTEGTCELVDPDSTAAQPVALTAPREIDADRLARFKELLVDPQSWWFARKRCLPRPTAVVRMRGPKGNVTVSLGFSCVLWIITGRAECRSGFFDPVQHHVREILKSTFPEFASADRRSMWRFGTITHLKKQRVVTQAGK
ncbi:MAG: hypothetical protein WD403_01665 [Pirellulales bacterium]